ncbi:hypothetical protein BJ912DRAFT_602221 [Pholiota molesta]|nr:hypothetical protein BJ912DRAFT_602221 [Pholiota molesta]
MTTDAYTSLLLHPVLAFSQGSGSPTQSTDHPCPIHWDLRVSSVNARLYGDPNRPLTFGHLAGPATQPTVGSLDITCGIFEKWPIEVRRPEGIAVADVLEAIRSTLRQRISHTEWEDFSESQRQKIEVVFNKRWMALKTRMRRVKTASFESTACFSAPYSLAYLFHWKQATLAS